MYEKQIIYSVLISILSGSSITNLSQDTLEYHESTPCSPVSWHRNDIVLFVSWSANGFATTSTYETNTLYTALATSLAKVRNATYLTTTRNANGASIVKLRDEEQKELWLMWNTKGSQSTAFTHTFATTPYKVWDVWGAELQVTSTLYMTNPHKVVWVQPNE